MAPIRVLELFSGMGGMHYAIKKAATIGNFEFEVVKAVDISDVANKVYRHNFPKVDLKGNNICGLAAESLNKLEIDAIFMSPPCQPFTRQGNQKDLEDARSHPLVHIVNELIPKMTRLNYILVENVKGFECSDAHKILMECLAENDFFAREFLLCPKQFGIPNSRLRYYAIARRKCDFTFGENHGKILDNLDCVPHDMRSEISKITSSRGPTLESYMEQPSPELDSFLLDDKTLAKHGQILDIVRPESTVSCCFTKSYGRYAEGTGSVVQQDGDLDKVYKRMTGAKGGEEKASVLRELKLRYFTPHEVSALMGFPEASDFSFPNAYTDKPVLCYRVLGNSLNVTVVAMLTLLLLGT